MLASRGVITFDGGNACMDGYDGRRGPKKTGQSTRAGTLVHSQSPEAASLHAGVRHAPIPEIT